MWIEDYSDWLIGKFGCLTKNKRGTIGISTIDISDVYLFGGDVKKVKRVKENRCCRRCKKLKSK